MMLKVTISEMRRDIAKQLGISSSSLGCVLTQVQSLRASTARSPQPAQCPDLRRRAPPPRRVRRSTSTPSNGLKATLQRLRALRRHAHTSPSRRWWRCPARAAKFTVGGEFPLFDAASSVRDPPRHSSTSSSTASCTTGAAFKPYGNHAQLRAGRPLRGAHPVASSPPKWHGSSTSQHGVNIVGGVVHAGPADAKERDHRSSCLRVGRSPPPVCMQQTVATQTINGTTGPAQPADPRRAVSARTTTSATKPN